MRCRNTERNAYKDIKSDMTNNVSLDLTEKQSVDYLVDREGNAMEDLGTSGTEGEIISRS